MTRRLLLILILSVAIVAGRANATSSQGDETAAKEQAARQAAVAKIEQARADEIDKSRKTFFDSQRTQSEANLNSMSNSASEARARANETRFAEMQTSASLLLSLSQKINGELQAGGAQSISVFLFKDLEDVEKTVKALRKAAK